MNKIVSFLLALFIVALIAVSCSKDETTGPDTTSPTVSITNPTGDEIFIEGDIINIAATASDNKEIKNVKFYIDGLLMGTDTEEPYETIWNTENLIGNHIIYGKAIDTSDNEALSNTINVTIIEDNVAPNKPSNPSPSNNATEILSTTTLSWDCSDANGDPLIYDVYFGTSNNPNLVSEGQNATTFELEELSPATIYYWKIIAHDDHSNTTIGDIWQFTTISNESPFIWEDILYPDDNTCGWSSNSVMRWGVVDYDSDVLYVDFYLGDSNNPELFVEDMECVLDEDFYIYSDRIELDENTTYFWKISVTDGINEVTSELYSFTTSNMEVLSETDINMSISYLTNIDDVLYAKGDNDKIIKFDNNAYNPQIDTYIELDSRIIDLECNDSYLIAATNYKFYIIDPSILLILDTIELDNYSCQYVYNICCNNDKAYLEYLKQYSNNHYLEIDISDPNNVQVLYDEHNQYLPSSDPADNSDAECTDSNWFINGQGLYRSILGQYFGSTQSCDQYDPHETIELFQNFIVGFDSQGLKCYEYDLTTFGYNLSDLFEGSLSCDHFLSISNDTSRIATTLKNSEDPNVGIYYLNNTDPFNWEEISYITGWGSGFVGPLCIVGDYLYVYSYVYDGQEYEYKLLVIKPEN